MKSYKSVQFFGRAVCVFSPSLSHIRHSFPSFGTEQWTDEEAAAVAAATAAPEQEKVEDHNGGGGMDVEANDEKGASF